METPNKIYAGRSPKIDEVLVSKTNAAAGGMTSFSFRG